MGQETYKYLQELSSSDFEIVEDEPNIIGWSVKDEKGTYIGQVSELLFEPETRAVRYLVVDLKDNGMNLEGKEVMIPLGIAHLHRSDDEVVLPGLHLDQYQALPVYESGQLGPDVEVQIRSVIGSPAALRMEETIVAFDQDQFYKHHHFDRGRFYHRGGLPVPVPEHIKEQHRDHLADGQMANKDEELQVPALGHMADPHAELLVPVPDHIREQHHDQPLTGQLADRTEEQETIHDLVENSKEQRQHVLGDPRKPDSTL